jgi:hypothetical protein
MIKSSTFSTEKQGIFAYYQQILKIGSFGGLKT